MEVDNNTKPTYVNIVVDDSKEYLDELRTQADEDTQNEGLEEGEAKKMSIRDEGCTISTDEIYFEDGCLNYSGYLKSKKGNTYLSLTLPLSQEILFDVLGESIKKFNKVKTLMETTK